MPSPVPPELIIFPPVKALTPIPVPVASKRRSELQTSMLKSTIEMKSPRVRPKPTSVVIVEERKFVAFKAKPADVKPWKNPAAEKRVAVESNSWSRARSVLP